MAKKPKKIKQTETKVLLDLAYEGLTSLDYVLKKTPARLVKKGKTVYLEVSPIMGRRMKLHGLDLILLGETKDNVAKVSVTDGLLEATDALDEMLTRLNKIEETLREMQAEKTRVRFEVE